MARRYSQDAEVREFRDIMAVPDQFEDGFGAKTVIGTIFIALFMLPGSLYLQLFMGQGLGPAARWVTVILFTEVARRSLKQLRGQETFILFYMTGITLATPFEGPLFLQYLVQSDAASALGVAGEIPSWAAPSAEVLEDTGRSFLNRFWLVPLIMVGTKLIISRINGFGLGYVLYRLTAHVERLPFPMAPVGAQGILALTEGRETKERWRWMAFGVGGVLGLGFGFIYIGIPSLTSSIFGTPYQLLPIPWLDLTTTTQDLLPATPVNIVFNMTLLVVGMVLPFWAVVGGFGGLIVTMVANPLLYKYGILATWRPGMKVVDTLFSNHLDFYLSFTIGLMVAIFLVSITGILWSLLRARSKDDTDGVSLRQGFRRNRLRGDIPIWMSLGAYVLSVAGYIAICYYLIEDFPWWFFLGFSFLYIPLISYATAKLEGMVGQVIKIPLVREAAFILSGAKGVGIWFAPIPIYNWGTQVRQFRIVELTGTRMPSVIKTELLAVPVVVVSLVLFSEFIWRLGEIPSEAYPYTQEVWRLQALQRCLQYTATMEGGSKFLEALHGSYIAWGLGSGVVSFIVLWLLGLPTFLVYGLVRGLGQTTPGMVVPEFIGCLIGRFYLRKKLGPKRWRRTIPVVLAGFSCGMGLIAMAAVAIALIAKSVSTLVY